MTPPTWNVSPSMEARSSRRRSSGSSRSSRAVQQTLDRGRHGYFTDTVVALGEHGEHLLEKERIPLRRRR